MRALCSLALPLLASLAAGCLGDDLALPAPEEGAPGVASRLHLRFTTAPGGVPRTFTWEVASPEGEVVAGATWTMEPETTRAAATPLRGSGTFRVVVSDEDLGGKSEARVDPTECDGRAVTVEFLVTESGRPRESGRLCG